jgi:hypothetical protein
MIYSRVNDCAKEIHNSGIFELYTIRNSSAEKVRSLNQLNDLLANGVEIYIQVGSHSLEIARLKNEFVYGSYFLEAHYEIVSMLERMRSLPEPMQPPLIRDINEKRGTGGFWKYAEELTKEFHAATHGRDWPDGDFFELVERFVTERIMNQ